MTITDITGKDEELSNSGEHSPYKQKYSEKFRGYEFNINWTSSEHYTEEEVVEVRLNTRDGKKYEAPFVPRKHIDYAFDKNKRTGEFDSGTYLAYSGMIVVEEVDGETVKRTIDDLIKRFSVENFFKEID